MKNLIKTAIIFLLVINFTVVLRAQYMNLGTATQSEVNPPRWFVGGMLGGSISSYGGSFEIAPIIGYKLTPAFSVGTRLTYIYSSYKDSNIGKRYNLNDYGAGLFARYQFYKFLFGQVEYEALSLELPPYYALTLGEDSRQWINSLFIGGGIIQPMGGRGFASIAIMFNLLESEKSSYVYSNPIIRVGFGVGF